MWLFLATEVMFFTGLIGSYIVLRAGSPSTGVQQPLLPRRPTSTTLEDTDGRADRRRPVRTTSRSPTLIQQRPPG